MGIKKGLVPRSLNEVGFTLIEMIVVIAVIAVTLPSVFAIVFTIVRQQTKIYRISKVKSEGDYILNLISNTIKNSAVSIYSTPTADVEVCNDATPDYSSSALYFRDLSNNVFGYLISDSAISSSSATTINLNSSNVKFSNFSISCNKTASFSNANISLSFDIIYNTTSTRPEETASLHYQTRVKMRN